MKRLMDEIQKTRNIVKRAEDDKKHELSQTALNIKNKPIKGSGNAINDAMTEDPYVAKFGYPDSNMTGTRDMEPELQLRNNLGIPTSRANPNAGTTIYPDPITRRNQLSDPYNDDPQPMPQVPGENLDPDAAYHYSYSEGYHDQNGNPLSLDDSHYINTPYGMNVFNSNTSQRAIVNQNPTQWQGSVNFSGPETRAVGNPYSDDQAPFEPYLPAFDPQGPGSQGPVLDMNEYGQPIVWRPTNSDNPDLVQEYTNKRLDDEARGIPPQEWSGPSIPELDSNNLEFGDAMPTPPEAEPLPPTDREPSPVGPPAEEAGPLEAASPMPYEPYMPEPTMLPPRDILPMPWNMPPIYTKDLADVPETNSDTYVNAGTEEAPTPSAPLPAVLGWGQGGILPAFGIKPIFGDNDPGAREDSTSTFRDLLQNQPYTPVANPTTNNDTPDNSTGHAGQLAPAFGPKSNTWYGINLKGSPFTVTPKGGVVDSKTKQPVDLGRIARWAYFNNKFPDVAPDESTLSPNAKTVYGLQSGYKRPKTLIVKQRNGSKKEMAVPEGSPVLMYQYPEGTERAGQQLFYDEDLNQIKTPQEMRDYLERINDEKIVNDEIVSETINIPRKGEGIIPGFDPSQYILGTEGKYERNMDNPSILTYTTKDGKLYQIDTGDGKGNNISITDMETGMPINPTQFGYQLPTKPIGPSRNPIQMPAGVYYKVNRGKAQYVDASGRILDPKDFQKMIKTHGNWNDIQTNPTAYFRRDDANAPALSYTYTAKQKKDGSIDVTVVNPLTGTTETQNMSADAARNNGFKITEKSQPMPTGSITNPIRASRMSVTNQGGELVYNIHFENKDGKEWSRVLNPLKQEDQDIIDRYTSEGSDWGYSYDGAGGIVHNIMGAGGEMVSTPFVPGAEGGPVARAFATDSTSTTAPIPGAPSAEPSELPPEAEAAREEAVEENDLTPEEEGIFNDAFKKYMMYGIPIGLAVSLALWAVGGAKPENMIGTLAGGAGAGALLGGLGGRYGWYDNLFNDGSQVTEETPETA